jgi:YVTN family beta-propeller protein
VKPRSAIPYLLLVTTLAACGSTGGGQPASRRPGPTRPATAGTIVTTVPVANQAVAMAFDGRYLWVGSADSGSVTQVDTTIGQAIRTTKIGGRPIGITVTADGVWVADNAGSAVTRLDSGTGQPTATVRVGPNPLGFAQINQDLWVFSQSEQRATVLDPRTATVTRIVPLPGLGGGYPDVAAGSIWVPDLSGTTRSVWQINPDSGQVTRRIATGPHPAEISFGFGSGWVTDEQGVTRFDPATGKVQARITDLGRQLDGIATTADAVWVVSIADNRLTKVDPTTNLPVATLDVCTGPRHLLVVGDYLWVACLNSGLLVQVQPN